MEGRSVQRSDLLVPHQPLGELLGDVAGHAQGIVRTEVRLAIAQVRDELSEGARRVTLLGGASVFALVGCLLLLIAGAMALATIVAAWLAVLIIAGVAFLASLILLGLGGRTKT